MINVNQITSELAKMPDQALQQYAAMHKNDPYMVTLALSESNRRKQMRMGAQGAGAMPQPKVVDQDIAQMASPPQQQALPEDSGIAQLPAQNMQNMAGGGIVAFDDGGEVPGYKDGGLPLAPYIEKYSQEYKLDPSVLSRIVEAESKGKITAKNPVSTAHGAGQLLNEMWKKMGGGDRQDAETQVRNAAKLLRSNTDNFKRATGREPSAAEAYTTWVLGDSTGRAVLNAPPNASVEDVIKKADPKRADDIIEKNPSLFKNKSVADVMQWATTKTTPSPAIPVATAQAQTAPAPAKGITALTDSGTYSDPSTGFSIPQDVFSPSPEEQRKYSKATDEAKKREALVNQIPGQSGKAPAYKDENTYFGGLADQAGIPQEVQRNVSNTLNATSGWTAPIGGVNRAATGIAKGLEPTAEMIQKAEQAKVAADTLRMTRRVPGLEALDEASAATRAAAENARRMRQLEEDRKAATGAQQSVEAATKTANIADKTAQEIAAAQDAAILNQSKMTGAAQGLAGMQAIDKAGGIPDLTTAQPAVAPVAPVANAYPSGIMGGARLPDTEPTEEAGLETLLPKAEEKKGGTDWNDLMIKMGLNLMASKDPNAISGVGQAGLGTLGMMQAEEKAKSEAAYREAMGKHYTMPSSEIQTLEWARDPKNMALLKQIAQAKADPKASAQEALAFLKDAGVVLKETDPVLYGVLRNKVLGNNAPTSYLDTAPKGATIY